LNKQRCFSGWHFSLGRYDQRSKIRRSGEIKRSKKIGSRCWDQEKGIPDLTKLEILMEVILD